MRGRLPRPRDKGGVATGPSPADRRKTGSKHRPTRDGKDTPLHVTTTAANVNDITQTLTLVDNIPPVTAGRPGRPRRRPSASWSDTTYDSKAVHHALRRRRIMPVISRQGLLGHQGPGQAPRCRRADLCLLHQFKRLAAQWERRIELHDALISLACGSNCWRRLKKHRA
ncbi:transposase [Streptomyces sp. NPDC003032]